MYCEYIFYMNKLAHAAYSDCDCPDMWLYEGITVGSSWNQAGTAEFLCLHREPQFHRVSSGQQDFRAKIYGTEYRALDSAPDFSHIHHHDVSCSVCYTPTRSTKITIPGRTTCPADWTMEYTGYLMTGRHTTDHFSRVPVCVNVNSQPIPGTGASVQLDRSLLYFIEVVCTGIPCSNTASSYQDGVEIACVVCTK